MAGNLFILRSDITRLQCDAWLLPCAKTFRAAKRWWADHTCSPPVGEGADPTVRRVSNWLPNYPQPWLVHISGGRFARPEWFAKRARAFVKTVCGHGLSARYRHKPLLALPVIGTGKGGGRGRAGAILTQLIPTLLELAAEYDVDIALVAWEDHVLAAAQRERLRILSKAVGKTKKGPLGPRHVKESRRLGALARSGRLALFVGAGVSLGAGLPSWRGLLRNIAATTSLSTDALEHFDKLSLLDQAALLASSLRDETLGSLIAKQFSQAKHFSLAHALLATLPVQAVITTNYDQLFEQASAGAGIETAVLPYQPASSKQRWVLKMHGCVTTPDDIVLQRSDYLRYNTSRAALKGIVQAALITNHMLFVGFSLRDQNFHEAADDVRLAMHRATPERFGSVLLVQPETFFDRLWGKDLHAIHFASKTSEQNVLEAARLQEIFLDQLCAEATLAKLPVFRRSYDAVLSPGERELRGGIEEMVATLPPTALKTESWKTLKATLENMGLTGPLIARLRRDATKKLP